MMTGPPLKRPATRTVPSESSVALWSARLALMLPITLKEPVSGAYSSALLAWEKSESHPPATRTFPLGSSVVM